MSLLTKGNKKFGKPLILPPPKLTEMKELLMQMASYHIWSNQRIADLVLTLPEEKHLATVPSSFPSLHATMLHMWDAESIWWQRLRLHERFVRPSDHFKGSFRDVLNGLMSQSRLWETWISNASDRSLTHVFEYRNSKKELFKMHTWQLLLHIFNHGTYHRGQMVNMLHQLEVGNIPATDFVVWMRGRRMN